MKRRWTAVLVLLVGGLLIIPRSQPPHRMQPNERNLSPQAELTLKQQLIAEDVNRTAQLCRSQCSIDLKEALVQLRSVDGGPDVLATLKQLQKQHPHMSKLQWKPHGGGEDRAVTVGQLEPEVETATARYWKEAQSSAAQGQPYESPALTTAKGPYFVLSVPSADGKAMLVGVVHQDILDTVRNHQVRNLRVVPYPPEGISKIESVDSRTLQDVTVTHPEENEGTSHYHKNEVVVRFNRTMTDAELVQMQKEIGSSLPVRKLGYTYVFRSDKMEAKQLMDYFKKWPIAYVEPHFFYMTNEATRAAVPPAETPNDQLYARYQWNLPIVETELGWDVGKGSQDVVVGVVDTGVDLNHTDLQGHLLEGTNIVTPGDPPMDDVGHGTHVAGVISALVNNGQGVAGMTWFNPILPVKVLDESGAGSTYAVAQGLIWAVDHGAKVVNMSLGNYADANFLHDAVQYAFDHDVVMVAASGNDNTDKPGFPAAYPEVLGVAATDANKQKAPFSNYGDYIGVSAPGVSIASTYPSNQYAALSGTSMATPHVAALAALVRSVNPQLKNTEVMDIIKRTAEDLGPPGKDPYFGYGQIDVVKALQAARDAAGPATGSASPAPADTGSPADMGSQAEPSPAVDWRTLLQNKLGAIFGRTSPSLSPWGISRGVRPTLSGCVSGRYPVY